MRVQLIVGRTTGTVSVIEGDAPTTTGVWYHAAATRESGVWKLYVNGGQQVSTITPTYNATTGIELGHGVMNGSLSYAAIYNCALSAATILEHYTAGTAGTAGTGSGIPVSTIDAKGDVLVGTANDALDNLAVGTDGQVLTADSTQTTGVKWATPAAGGSVATDTIWDTKGDLAVATGADAASKLAAGSNGQVLTADSTQSTGLKWAAAAGGGAWTLLSTTTLGASGTFDVSSISGSYNDLVVVFMVRGAVSGAVDALAVRFNNDTAAHYGSQIVTGSGATASASAENAQTSLLAINTISGNTAAAGSFSPGWLYIVGYASTSWQKTVLSVSGLGLDITAGNKAPYLAAALWNQTSAINRIQAFGRTTANLVTGSQMRIYGIT